MSTTETPTTPERATPWTFILARTGKGNDPLSERIAAAIRHAESRGITVTTLRIDLDASDCHARGAQRVRLFLKRCLRDCGLRASWPAPARRTRIGGRQ